MRSFLFDGRSAFLLFLKQPPVKLRPRPRSFFVERTGYYRFHYLARLHLSTEVMAEDVSSTTEHEH